MVNFRDPAVIAQDLEVTTNLWHMMSGIYFWEFFTTLEYELSVIRGRRPYRRTIWVYSLARVGALLGVILGIVLLDATHPIRCRVIVSFMGAFNLLALLSSSSLIVLRIIAVWNRNRVVVATVISIWGINAGFFLQRVIQLQFASEPFQPTCVPVKVERTTLSFIAIPITDIALLLILLVGLLRLHYNDGSRFGLAQLLWRQGVIYLFLATIAEVPPLVFIILNLNVPFDIMFQLPSWITMAITATRMHRSLVYFASDCTDVRHEGLQHDSLRFKVTKQIDPASAPMDRLEVAVHIASEQRGTQQIGDDDSFIDDQLRENLNGMDHDNDLECGL